MIRGKKLWLGILSLFFVSSISFLFFHSPVKAVDNCVTTVTGGVYCQSTAGSGPVLTADPVDIVFDDLSGDTGIQDIHNVPSPYAGLKWSNLYVMANGQEYNDGGTNFAYNNPSSSSNSSISALSGQTFNLNSVDIGLISGTGRQIQVTGYSGTKVVYDKTLDYGDAHAWTHWNIGYFGITKVVFSSPSVIYGLDNIWLSIPAKQACVAAYVLPTVAKRGDTVTLSGQYFSPSSNAIGFGVDG